MSYESNRACVACDFWAKGMVCYHHLRTRKARPDLKDKEWNMIPVCQKHHNEFHNKGIDYMARNYLTVLHWLRRNGWSYNVFREKWLNNKEFCQD